MHPAFVEDLPDVSVVVELEEGVRMVSSLRGIEPKALRLQLPVSFEFESFSPDVALPNFHPFERDAAD